LRQALPGLPRIASPHYFEGVWRHYREETAMQHVSENTEDGQAALYWAANLKLLFKLLAVWFVVSFGAGILFVDTLNAVSFLGVPLGFWFAQQGAIYVFVILIFVYATQIEKIEQRFGLNDGIDNEGDDA
jgi:putative solute:sodium symporter small subunit